jgi:hypothetical protein
MYAVWVQRGENKISIEFSRMSCVSRRHRDVDSSPHGVRKVGEDWWGRQGWRVTRSTCMSRSSLTDRSHGSIYRQLAEAFHDVFGEENRPIFFLISGRVITNWIDDVDIGWMDDRGVGESKDVYELVSEYDRIYCRQRGCCRPWCKWWNCRGGTAISRLSDSRGRAAAHSERDKCFR